jgi:beta-glucosidase/6-phospho-beta-glucosidase/beta-galactosidase
VISLLDELGLEPIVTLNHLTLPIWVLDPPRESHITSAAEVPIAREDNLFLASLRGWETKETVDAFVIFVRKVAEHYSGKGVRFWITLNEPVGSMIGVGYIGGIWPPGFSLEGERAKTAYFNLLRAHVQAYQTIKEVYGEVPVQIGIAHAMLFTKSSGASPVATGAGVGAAIGGAAGLVIGLPAAVVGAAVGAIVGAIAGGAGNIHEAARNQFDYFYNDHILDSLISGQVDKEIHRRPDRRANEDAHTFFNLAGEEPWSPKLDFIGINYYRSVYPYYDQIISFAAGYTGGAFENDLRFSDRDHLLLNDLGWEICPLGLYAVIQRVLQYNLPILITENGMPQSEDRHRAAYTLAHLQQLLRAMRDGANVLGYIHWTLVDNFEWQEHYTPNARFGLFTREHPDQTRRITEGAFALRHAIADSTPKEAVRRYGAISQDGQRVQKPDLSPGSMWMCKRDESNFNLFVTKLITGRLGGCVFLLTERKWLPLEAALWEDNKLSFSFKHLDGSLHEFRGDSAEGELHGIWTGSGRRGEWLGDRLLAFGTWIKTDGSQVRNFEDIGEWTGKRFLEGAAAIWRILETVQCQENRVNFSMEPFWYNATILGDVMTGKVLNEEQVEIGEWSAVRAPTDLPF